MLYVFAVVVVASLVLSAYSVDELMQVLAGLSSTSAWALLLLGVAVGVWLWRVRRKK